MLRYLNMFVLIGIALIAVSLAGFATGGKFLIEPGQASDPGQMASFVYLGAGLLMIFNGVLSVRTATTPTKISQPDNDPDTLPPGADQDRSEAPVSQ